MGSLVATHILDPAFFLLDLVDGRVAILHDLLLFAHLDIPRFLLALGIARPNGITALQLAEVDIAHGKGQRGPVLPLALGVWAVVGRRGLVGRRAGQGRGRGVICVQVVFVGPVGAGAAAVHDGPVPGDCGRAVAVWRVELVGERRVRPREVVWRREEGWHGGG